MNFLNTYKTLQNIEINGTNYSYFDLNLIAQKFNFDIKKIPSSIKILLENLLRNEDGEIISAFTIESFCKNLTKKNNSIEISFYPNRVLMQDFTGVPAVADLAAMRDALKSKNIDPKKINPLSRVDLVIDHSVMVDNFGSQDSYSENVKKEYLRNKERYEFLKWGQNAFDNFYLVPPGLGICHQVNLEYIAKTIWVKETPEAKFLLPDSVVGTDSHTTMINALSVLGWGVGGIEAEAAMLGQPISMNVPEVIGFKITGKLNEGITATDLVLTITNKLRSHGVVGKFVEFFGTGLKNLKLADRATISNMSPEYGATSSFFPTDEETIKYLKLSGREEKELDIVREYTKVQNLWHNENDKIDYNQIIELDLNQVKATIAGPKRPQDKIDLEHVPKSFKSFNKNNNELRNSDKDLIAGDIVIAAITSCTNTSNPSVMLAAGLVAKKAVNLGLKVKPWVKTSLAPGSKVVSNYLKKSNLSEYLDQLGFNLVGYGCTTCIGNSGPLDKWISEKIKNNDLIVCSVLSGNRNFEGRIHQEIKANYLASPPLVVAYALAGNININLASDALGKNDMGQNIYLKDLWPTTDEIENILSKSLSKEQFIFQYKDIYNGDNHWENIKVNKESTFNWNKTSTYIKPPPFFDENNTLATQDILDGRILAMLGDSITTDHISHAGSIKLDSPAGAYLSERQINKNDFNSYGSRRGNHEIMMRGTFANIRIHNEILESIEGGYTYSFLNSKIMPIFDASMDYLKNNIPLIIIAGKEYGTGSSRDWAAKGTRLLGVKAVIAESFERIHRSNLIGMGVLPLEFINGNNRKTLKLTGKEKISIFEIENIFPKKIIKCSIKELNNNKNIELLCRIDTKKELEYFQAGGILHYVLNNIINKTS